jgi:hypothetical protein
MKENSNYQISTSVRDGIVEVVITGEITKNTLDRLRAEVITILREINPKAVLCDVSALKGPNDITAAYFRARSTPQDVKILPAAIVDLSENKDFQSFYETTAANTGQLLKYFTDIEAARAWLKTMF